MWWGKVFIFTTPSPANNNQIGKQEYSGGRADWIGPRLTRKDSHKQATTEVSKDQERGLREQPKVWIAWKKPAANPRPRRPKQK